ncbi:MAG: hypothetical protein IKW03_06675 [Clostridia bacterium]|nr:hypothetical protein [Clostridia bacterium]
MNNYDEILKKIKTNTTEENKKLFDEITGNMTESQNESVKKLISDPERMKKLIESPAVKNILNKLGEQGNGNK